MFRAFRLVGTPVGRVQLCLHRLDIRVSHRVSDRNHHATSNQRPRSLSWCQTFGDNEVDNDGDDDKDNDNDGDTIGVVFLFVYRISIPFESFGSLFVCIGVRLLGHSD